MPPDDQARRRQRRCAVEHGRTSWEQLPTHDAPSNTLTIDQAIEHAHGTRAHERMVLRPLRLLALARPATIQKGTRVLSSLWDSLMLGRVPQNGAHSEISTRVPFCIQSGHGRARLRGSLLGLCVAACADAVARPHLHTPTPAKVVLGQARFRPPFLLPRPTGCSSSARTTAIEWPGIDQWR